MSLTQTRPDAPKVTGLPTLTLQLTRARLLAREGAGVLTAASVFAYVVCATLALTVAGGTWMFYNRWRHPHGLIAEVLALDPTFDTLLIGYFALAILACALLVPSMIALASGAAVLGARSRERRLAALRLIGLSSGDVTRMSLIDTLLQAVAGALIGLVVYLVSLPAWQALTMIAMPIEAHEMLLPWWGIAAVLVATVLIGLAASAWGLRQVRITPLGVARRAISPALRWWRLIAFAGLMVISGVLISLLQLHSLIAFYILAGVIVAVIFGMNMFAPWLLQQIAGAIAQLPSPTINWAGRRVQANAKQTWQRVSGIGVLSFIGGFIALLPITADASSDAPQTIQDFVAATQWDFTKGVIITLAVGFVVTATSIFISQASAVFERAEQSQSLARMGAPTGYLTRVMWLETLGPLVIAIVLGTGLGMGMASPMISLAAQFGLDATTGPLIMGAVLLSGIGLAVLALLACGPLQRQVLAGTRRKND